MALLRENSSQDYNSISDETALVKPFNTTSNEHKETKTPYPKSVFFIISNEFCERFSYYGMKTILTLYFVNKLGYSDSFGTMVYHIFAGACYFTPVFGAIISDSFLGKFRTIFYISLIYAAGNIILSISALPTLGFNKVTTEAIGMLGLGLIAFGTGGIKPCVSAFGGDQFSADQEKELQKFFSFFYISINAGSLISTFITPILRATSCLGQEDCFSLAFGVPAILMVCALILFVIGKSHYKMVPPKGNILVEVSGCICYALKKKIQSKGVKRESWLDYADDKYDKTLIEDIKPVLRVLFLYIPLPCFWALFDQQGSRWTLQSTRLDATVTDSYRLEPDQMQVVNPLLIIIAIPIMEYGVYPLFAKINFLVRPLQRMVVGGFLAAGAFVLAFFLQLGIEGDLPILPDAGHGHLNVFNSAPCQLNMSSNFESLPVSIDSSNFHEFLNIPAGKNVTIGFLPIDCREAAIAPKNYTFSLKNEELETLMVSIVNNEIDFYKTNDTLDKPSKGRSDVRVFFYTQNQDYYTENSTFTFERTGYKYNAKIINDSAGTNVGSTDYELMMPGTYSLFLPNNKETAVTDGDLEKKFTFQSGGKYILLVNSEQNGTTVVQHTVVKANTLSIFLQIPQYVVITFGEVMFSITGLEFSYSQAPASMKSVLQAGWLMTVFFGNIIVVVVSNARIAKQSTEFIIFACLMVVDMIIFAVMAYFYKPVQTQQQTQEEKDSRLTMNGMGKKNEAFVDDNTTKM